MLGESSPVPSPPLVFPQQKVPWEGEKPFVEPSGGGCLVGGPQGCQLQEQPLPFSTEKPSC